MIWHSLNRALRVKCSSRLSVEPTAGARSVMPGVLLSAVNLFSMSQVLLEILNARLADIRDWWSSGALQARTMLRFAIVHCHNITIRSRRITQLYVSFLTDIIAGRRCVVFKQNKQRT
jgi:hypothetical protein